MHEIALDLPFIQQLIAYYRIRQLLYNAVHLKSSIKSTSHQRYSQVPQVSFVLCFEGVHDKHLASGGEVDSPSPCKPMILINIDPSAMLFY